MRTRYTLIGVGSRGYNVFARPLVTQYDDVGELVGLCDINSARMELATRKLGIAIPCFASFDEMLATAKPDVVLVATVDATHHTYIIRALESGCDVITEKPLTTTAGNAQLILEVERRTGHKVRGIVFNARYMAPSETIQQLLRQGAIGDLISVDFAEYLDTAHGADYFRRWHRRKANSGGLLIHKATHHFDQINWWVGADPETVYALGTTRFYGPTRAERGERCLTCACAGRCPFFLDLRANTDLKELYLDTEAADGYLRDRCVFSDEIDIEDTMVVSLRYQNGVLVNYVLDAFAPYEGQRIGFNGSKGRLEVDLVDRYHGLDELGRVRILKLDTPNVVRVSPLFGRPYTVPIEQRTGGHGGADERIQAHLFRDGLPDPLGQRADSRAGAMSMLVGAAANLSIASGKPVRIADIFQG